MDEGLKGFLFTALFMTAPSRVFVPSVTEEGGGAIGLGVFSSEEVANKEMEMRKNHRKESTEEHKISMVEEFVGPVLAQLSELR